jgi:hypothetical protein
MSASTPEPPYPSSEAAESDPPPERDEEHPHRKDRPDDYPKQEPERNRQESDRERDASYDSSEVGDAGEKSENDPLRWPVERADRHEVSVD